MKRLLFYILAFLPFLAISQTSNGTEEVFNYGIKNNASTIVTSPVYLVSQGVDGTQGKVSPYDLPIPNKVQDSLDAIRADIPTPLGYTPENVANKITAIYGSSTTEYPSEKAVVDYVGSKTSKVYANVVYVNATNPTTATIFDLANPPVTNDDDLKEDTANLYIGDDSSTWVWNGSIYTTKVVPESSNFTINGTEVDAGNSKTSPLTRIGSVTVQEKLYDPAVTV